MHYMTSVEAQIATNFIQFQTFTMILSDVRTYAQTLLRLKLIFSMLQPFNIYKNIILILITH